MFVVLAYVAVILLLFGLYGLIIWKKGWEQGVQAASTIATTLATVVLGIFTWQQMLESSRSRRVEHTGRWGELRNVMWDVFDQYPPKGAQALDVLPPQQQIAWLRNMRKLLDSQISNPVLIQDQECLGHWRNAISSVKTAADLLERVDAQAAERFFGRAAAAVLADVGHVWEKLVLESSEVSPTGGRPQQ